MLEWYSRTHAWNRITLTGLLIATVAKTASDNPLNANIVGLPLAAGILWGLGWAAIAGWKRTLKRWKQAR